VSPVFAVILAALVLSVPALLYVTWPLARRRADRMAAPDEERLALDAERVAALRALRELLADREAGHLADATFDLELERHEARAAAVLRRLDALGASPRAPVGGAATGIPAPGEGGPTATAPWTRRPATLGVFALGILVFGVALGVLVTRFAAPTTDGGRATDGEPVVSGGPPSLGDPGRVGGASGTARPLTPEMLRGMLQAARASLEAGRYQEAIAAYKAILKRDPVNVDAITHLGLILAMAGHAEGALEAFDRALAIDGDYLEALWYKASVLADAKRDDKAAIAVWERFSRVAAPGPEREQALLRIREARARLAAGGIAPPAAPSGAGDRRVGTPGAGAPSP